MITSTQYEDYLRRVLGGTFKSDRTGVGTVSIFGQQMRFSLCRGFPLITTKKVHFKSIAIELLWFLNGLTNVKWLQERGVTIWDEWADENGELGPVYGAQWRSWPNWIPASDDHEINMINRPIDQLAKVIATLKTNPDSRRMVVSAWNPSQLGEMALEPCHCFFQFYVANGELSCQVYQRSCDSFLGVPFNIASYALLTHLVAHQCDLMVGDLVWTGGDCHVYTNHFEQVREQLTREPRPFPVLVIKRRPANVWDYEYEDLEIVDYDPHPSIKAPVAV